MLLTACLTGSKDEKFATVHLAASCFENEIVAFVQNVILATRAPSRRGSRRLGRHSRLSSRHLAKFNHTSLLISLRLLDSRSLLFAISSVMHVATAGGPEHAELVELKRRLVSVRSMIAVEAA